jgi:hypothetical protein
MMIASGPHCGCDHHRGGGGIRIVAIPAHSQGGGYSNPPPVPHTKRGGGCSQFSFVLLPVFLRYFAEFICQKLVGLAKQNTGWCHNSVCFTSLY